MSDKVYTKYYNTDEVIIDCFYCVFHNYDAYGPDYEEFEVCDKGHVVYPSDCDDFKRK